METFVALAFVLVFLVAVFFFFRFQRERKRREREAYINSLPSRPVTHQRGMSEAEAREYAAKLAKERQKG